MSAATKIGCANHRRSYVWTRVGAQGVLLPRLSDARAGEAALGLGRRAALPLEPRARAAKLGLARPRDERIFPTAFNQINQLKELRADLPWLADVPRNVCTQLLVELDKAFQRCFRRLARAPRFKRKGRDLLGLTERRKGKVVVLRVPRRPSQSSAR